MRLAEFYRGGAKAWRNQKQLGAFFFLRGFQRTFARSQEAVAIDASGHALALGFILVRFNAEDAPNAVQKDTALFCAFHLELDVELDLAFGADFAVNREVDAAGANISDAREFLNDFRFFLPLDLHREVEREALRPASFVGVNHMPDSPHK